MRTGTRLEQVSVLTLLTSFCWEGRKRQKEKVQGGDGGGREDDEWRRQIEGGGRRGGKWWGKHNKSLVEWVNVCVPMARLFQLPF
jgi:hypothetical protein